METVRKPDLSSSHVRADDRSDDTEQAKFEQNLVKVNLFEGLLIISNCAHWHQV